MKTFLILFFSISIYGLLLAQDAGETRFGFQLSPTLTWMTTDDPLINSNGQKLGFKIGGVLEHSLTSWMHLTTGAGFSLAQGGALLHKFGGNLLPESKLSDPSYNQGEKPLPDNVEITYSIQMMEVPIGLKYTLGFPNRPFDLYLSFPEFHLAIIGATRGKIDATGIRLKGENLGKDVKPFQFAWGAGAGLDFGTDTGRNFLVGLHYQGGLADITANDGTRVMGNPGGGALKEKEDSRGTVSGIILRFVYLF